MVGDPEILKPTLARSLCHRLEGLGPVRRICMAVEDSAQVLVSDELRQLALQSQFDLAAPFPQFRIDERQAESAIDLALPLAIRVRPLCKPSVSNRIPFSAAKAWSCSM